MPQIFDTPIFTGDQSIERVLNAGLPVLLVFLDGSPAPALDQQMKALAKQTAGQLLVAQVNVKDSPEAARRYAVHRLPAVAAVHNQQVQSKAEGITGGDLQRHADYLLGKGPKPVDQSTTREQASSGSTAPGGHPITVSEAAFEQEVLRSAVPVVVDFWAPWCGPCRMVAPTLEKLAVEWNGRVKIAKVNVDENPNISGQLGITGIPTMIVYAGGKVVDRWAGALPEPALRARLAQSLH